MREIRQFVLSYVDDKRNSHCLFLRSKDEAISERRKLRLKGIHTKLERRTTSYPSAHVEIKII